MADFSDVDAGEVSAEHGVDQVGYYRLAVVVVDDYLAETLKELEIVPQKRSELVRELAFDGELAGVFFLAYAKRLVPDAAKTHEREHFKKDFPAQFERHRLVALFPSHQGPAWTMALGETSR
ncbi:MAG: hypothetical protein Q4C41_02360 [Eggerthellaceae bacterium]|nr:hypothetical protein [Eggerthellaceae bacterium]